MLLQILLNTPLYVYWIFFSLLFVGISQLKTREVGIKRALIIPIVLVILSVLGLLSDFGVNFISTPFWLIGIILATFLSRFIKKKKEIIFHPELKTFTIAGSYVPLTMMMLLFFVKYIVGAVTAMELEILHSSIFITCFSLLYGLFFGTYLLRFKSLIKKIKNNT